MEKHCGMLERVGDLTGGQLMAPVGTIFAFMYGLGAD
jgi:hypothetical protein